jgi:cysteine-rich repeat protein
VPPRFSQRSDVRPGLTLVELLLFIAIVSIMAASVVSFSLMSKRVEGQGEILAEVEQNGNLVVQELMRQIEQADTVIEPTPGSSSHTLILARYDTAQGPTGYSAFQTHRGRLRVIEDAGALALLTTRDVEVQDLIFLHYGNPSGEGSTGVSFAFRVAAKKKRWARSSDEVDRVFRGSASVFPSSCTTDGDCAGADVCCSGTCRRNCLTPLCSSDAECSGSEVCCLTDLPVGTVECAGESACKCDVVADCPQGPSCDAVTCDFTIPTCEQSSPYKCMEVTVGKCASCSDCPDGWLDRAVGEECDDGNDANDDACTNLCKIAVCGDSVMRIGLEECDDGNLASGDGCSQSCMYETLGTCGDGTPDVGEECDTGVSNSATDIDACRPNCRSAWCGDGVTDTGEECDDGNTLYRDGCSGSCEDENASTECGNGIEEEGEECDDGRRCTSTGDPCFQDTDCLSGTCTAFGGDGCSNACNREDICGDGRLSGSEVCDDGGICTGSSVAAYNDQHCFDIDPYGHHFSGTQRCIATGGTCTPDTRRGCANDCLRICRTRGELCFTDADCNEPDGAGCASCVNGECGPY